MQLRTSVRMVCLRVRPHPTCEFLLLHIGFVVCNFSPGDLADSAIVIKTVLESHLVLVVDYAGQSEGCMAFQKFTTKVGKETITSWCVSRNHEPAVMTTCITSPSDSHVPPFVNRSQLFL